MHGSVPVNPVPIDIVGCTFDGDQNTLRLVFDVTADIRRMRDDAGANFGWAIRDLHTLDTHLASRSFDSMDGAHPPELVITLATPNFAPTEPTAPPLDRGTPTTVFDGWHFLVDAATVPAPVQWGEAPGVFVPDRAGVIRGTIYDQATGEPLEGVHVHVLDHDEFGETRSRIDTAGEPTGRYDLLVNGGGSLVLELSQENYVTAQRTISVPWNGVVLAPDVALVREPSACTPALTASTPGFYFNEAGWTVDDPDGRGQRSMGVFVPHGTSVAGVGSYEICLRELTQGAGALNPEASMPAEIAFGTAYTFAAEGVVRDATTHLPLPESRFDDTNTAAVTDGHVVVYLRSDDFLNVPTATVVPVGTYDRAEGHWTPAPNGVVIEVHRGPGSCGVTPAGVVVDPDELHGICVANAAQFPDGSRFWRTALSHFSPWDCNWAPRLGDQIYEPEVVTEPVREKDPCARGSIIHCASRALSESFSVTGAAFGLAYHSGRQAGRFADYTVTVRPVPIADAPRVDTTLEFATVDVAVAGQTLPRATLTHADLQSGGAAVIRWNGLDGFGRLFVGPTTAHVTTTYHYRVPLAVPATGTMSFGASIVGLAGAIEGTDSLTTVVSHSSVTLGTLDERVSGLGGLGIDVHHTYLPSLGILYEGSGRRRTVSHAGDVAVGVLPPQPGDGLVGRHVASAPDGAIYYIGDFSSGLGRLRRFMPGVGSTELPIAAGFLTALAVTRDGDLYLGTPDAPATPDGVVPSAHCVVRVDDPLGAATAVPVVGTCGTTPGPDAISFGNPLLDPSLARLAPADLAVAADGSLYIIDESVGRLLRYRATAQGGMVELATTVPCAAGLTCFFDGVATGPNGAVYVSRIATAPGGAPLATIYQLRSDGTVQPVAGTDQYGSIDRRDGIDALDVRLYRAGTSRSSTTSIGMGGLAVDAQGRLYFFDHGETGVLLSDLYGIRIRRLEADGTLLTVAGPPPITPSGFIDPPTPRFGVRAFHDPLDRTATDPALPSPATATILIATGLDTLPNGTLISAGGLDTRGLVAVQPALEPGLTSNHVIAAEDGTLLFEFDPAGRHLRTLDSLTGADLFSFEYEADGRLSGVVDAEGAVTTITYSDAEFTITLTAPGELATRLTLDGPDGYVRTVEGPDPAAGTHTLSYSLDGPGLLTGLITPGQSTGHIFRYDANGLLETDADVNDLGDGTLPAQTLMVTPSAPGHHAVTLTTSQGSATTYESWRDARGEHLLTSLPTSGTVERVGGALGLPDLTVVRPDPLDAAQTFESLVEWSADPRFGADARFASRAQARRPSDASLLDVFTHTRSVVSESEEPLVDVVSVGGATSTREIQLTEDASGLRRIRTYPTSGSARGRRLDVFVDSRGRLRRVEAQGRAPICVGYSDVLSRRVGWVVQGAYAACPAAAPGSSDPTVRRQVSLSYGFGGLRWLRSIAAGYSTDTLTTMLTPDTLGRAHLARLPGHAYDVQVDYDDQGRIAHFYVPRGPAVFGGPTDHAFTYTARDLPLSYTPPGARFSGPPRVTVAYTEDGSPDFINLRDGRSIDFVFDDPATGIPTAVNAAEVPGRPDGSRYAITADGLGRALSIADAQQSLALGYDGPQLREQTRTAVLDRGVTGTVVRVIDHTGLPNREEVAQGAGRQSLNYGYDVDRALDTVSFGPLPAATPLTYSPPSEDTGYLSRRLAIGSLTTTVLANAFGELSSMTTCPLGLATCASTPTLYTVEICARDRLGRITQRIERFAGQSTIYGYGYDTAGRLVSRRQGFGVPTISCAAAAGLGSVRTFTYDQNGNRTDGPGMTTVTDDDQTSRPSDRHTYNEVGQLESIGSRTFDYDVFGRLRSTRRGRGRAPSTEYDYDALGRLTAVRTGRASTSEALLYRDRIRPIFWQRGSIRMLFGYLSQGHVPDVAFVDTNNDLSTIEETYRLITDERGSVRFVVRAVAGPEPAGTIVQRIDYDVWGAPSFVTGGAAVQPFGFAGGIWLAEAEFYHFGARDYEPAAGRWTTPDPAGFAAGENLYVYCANDPVNCIDPTGLYTYSAEETRALLQDALHRYRSRITADRDPLFGLGGSGFWDLGVQYCGLLDEIERNHDQDAGNSEHNYDFRFSQPDDFWIVSGNTLNAGQFGNYFAGYVIGGSLGDFGEFVTLEAGEYYAQREFGWDAHDDRYDQDLIRQGARDGRRHPRACACGE